MKSRIYKKNCPWCGKPFYGTEQKKYCSSMCRDEVERARVSARNHHEDSSTETILAVYGASHTKLKYVYESKVVPVHVSSSSMYWTTITSKRLVRE